MQIDEPIEVLATNVAFCDPAIDLSADDAPEMLEKYRATRDPAHVRLKPDVEPTRFVLSPIEAVFLVSTLENMVGPTRAMFSFLASCHEVKLPNGTSLKPKKLAPMAYGQNLADEKEWTATIRARFGVETLLEIGNAAFTLARLPEAARSTFRTARVERQ